MQAGFVDTCSLLAAPCRFADVISWQQSLSDIRDDEANRMLTRDYRSPFVVPDKV